MWKYLFILLTCSLIAYSDDPGIIEGLELPFLTPEVQFVQHVGYTLGYAEEYKQAAWVAYSLSKCEVLCHEVPERKDYFKVDYMVENAIPTNTFGAPYDRGHPAPAADFRWSILAYKDSYFMSNMSPQHRSFNRGIWKLLEFHVREWTEENELLYVVTGPVLEPGLDTLSNGMAIPRLYYKVLLDFTEPDFNAIGFVLPNEGSSEPLSAFAVTVDSVETLTGLDFYWMLEDLVETDLERRANLSDWELN